MTRLACLLCPVALMLASGCASTRCCGDPDPTPAHTFGRDGTVERAGGLLAGPRKFCPQCEWAGTKCIACRAKEGEAECACRAKERETECTACRAKDRELLCTKCSQGATCSRCGQSIAKGHETAHADVVTHSAPKLLPPKPLDDKYEANRMLQMLETKKVAPLAETRPPVKAPAAPVKWKKAETKETDEPEEANAGNSVSPYAPIREGRLMRTTR